MRRPVHVRRGADPNCVSRTPANVRGDAIGAFEQTEEIPHAKCNIALLQIDCCRGRARGSAGVARHRPRAVGRPSGAAGSAKSAGGRRRERAHRPGERGTCHRARHGDQPRRHRHARRRRAAPWHRPGPGQHPGPAQRRGAARHDHGLERPGGLRCLARQPGDDAGRHRHLCGRDPVAGARGSGRRSERQFERTGPEHRRRAGRGSAAWRTSRSRFPA